MNVSETLLPGVLGLSGDVFSDDRGWVTEVFRHERYAGLGLPPAFVQANHARSVRGVVRGLHWQDPRPQGKLIAVLHGAILDVVLDVRAGSPTFGRHIAVELSAGSGDQLWVPAGLAHGFCALTDTTDVLYLCTDIYQPDGQRGVIWNDPALGIEWPVASPVLSAKDAALPRLADLPLASLPRYGA